MGMGIRIDINMGLRTGIRMAIRIAAVYIENGWEFHKKKIL